MCPYSLSSNQDETLMDFTSAESSVEKKIKINKLSINFSIVINLRLKSMYFVSLYLNSYGKAWTM